MKLLETLIIPLRIKKIELKVYLTVVEQISTKLGQRIQDPDEETNPGIVSYFILILQDLAPLSE